MSKKQTKEKDTQKKDNDKSIKEEIFDVEKFLDEYSAPNMFKAGIQYYIKVNKFNIKNEKDIEKIIENYSKITMGD